MYDYIEGKKRINEILNSSVPVESKTHIPSDSAFTYENGIKSWVGSLFVDIRKSTELFNDNDDVTIAKMIRTFSSEIVEILNSSSIIKEVGIRGDCVYGIYDIVNCVDLKTILSDATNINCLILLLNKLFERKGFPKISIGIGLGLNEDLIIKSGRKGTGINDKIWICKAVIDACNNANLGSKYNGGLWFGSVVMSSVFYNNITEYEDWAKLFSSKYYNYKTYYVGNPVFLEFERWVNEDA